MPVIARRDNSLLDRKEVGLSSGAVPLRAPRTPRTCSVLLAVRSGLDGLGAALEGVDCSRLRPTRIGPYAN